MDRGINARHCGMQARAAALFGDRQRSQLVQIGIRSAVAIVDRKIGRAVAEAFQNLPQTLHAGFALAADVIQIHLDREHVLLPAGLVQYG